MLVTYERMVLWNIPSIKADQKKVSTIADITGRQLVYSDCELDVSQSFPNPGLCGLARQSSAAGDWAIMIQLAAKGKVAI